LVFPTRQDIRQESNWRRYTPKLLSISHNMVCGWWRNYFQDHLLYISKQGTTNRPIKVWGNTKHDKIRVYCKPCLKRDIGAIISSEESQSRHDPGFNPRDYNVICLACAYYYLSIPISINSYHMSSIQYPSR